MRFSIKDFFSKCDRPNLQIPTDLVTFTEEILNGKLHFLGSDIYTPNTAIMECVELD